MLKSHFEDQAAGYLDILKSNTVTLLLQVLLTFIGFFFPTFPISSCIQTLQAIIFC